MRALQSRGNIDAVAHQIAVALFDHVAQVNSDPKLYSALGGHTGVAFDHRVLNFHRAAHGVDDATELDQSAVAGALDDAAVMESDGRIDQVAAKRPELGKRAPLVGADEPAVANDVGHQNRRELLAHCALWQAGD